MSLHAPAIKSLFPSDLSSDSSSADTDEEDISAPTYSPITSDGSLFSVSSSESGSEVVLESSTEEEAGKHFE